jgi:hypothetical protein
MDLGVQRMLVGPSRWTTTNISRSGSSPTTCSSWTQASQWHLTSWDKYNVLATESGAFALTLLFLLLAVCTEHLLAFLRF